MSHSVKGTTHTNVYQFYVPRGAALENIRSVNYKTWKQDYSHLASQAKKIEIFRIEVCDADTRTGIQDYSHMIGIQGAYKNAAIYILVV